jgi:hypothetical protein
MTDQHRHHLEIAGYNELLAEHCELVDRVATLEQRFATSERPASPQFGLWIEAAQQLPPDDRQVLTFTNGYCSLYDNAGRSGGPWGIAIGWYDHERAAWYLAGQRPVTHWQPLPEPPTAAARLSKSDWELLAAVDRQPVDGH